MQEFREAIFNEGVLIAHRLDTIQHRINSIRMNALAFNIEYNCYNYQIWYWDLCSLMNEAFSKLEPKEKKDLNNLRILIDNALQSFPIHKNIFEYYKKQKKTIVNYKNWEKIKKLLFIFEQEVKLALDLHGFANPNKEGGELF